MNEFMDENINLEKAMLNTRKTKQASVIATGNLFPSISISSVSLIRTEYYPHNIFNLIRSIIR